MDKNTYNLKSVIVSLLLIIIGIGLALLDYFYLSTEKNIFISVGCSLLASGLVILFQTLLIQKESPDLLRGWKLTKIYSTRAEKNADSDPKLKDIMYQLDAVAFGLKTFRTKHGDDIKECLQRGVSIRILTMDPNSPFVSQREKEENETAGQIKKTIEDLMSWANNLNQIMEMTGDERTGRIQIRGYTCMTLDFYWRMDDELYFGPYWKGHSSQQTITYKYDKGGFGFKQYTEYFDSLWTSKDNITLIP